jgi:hypothetical protein
MAQNLTVPFLITARPKRLNWIELFNARSVKVKGADPNRKNFQVQWIIEKDDPDLKEMIEIAWGLMARITANRKQPLEGLVPHKDYHWPFYKGEDHIEKMRQSAYRAGREWKDEYEQQCVDKYVLYTSAPEAYPPVLIIPVQKGSETEFKQLDDPAARAAAQKHFYRGMMALGKVAFMGYDVSSTSWGVTAFVNEVCATGEGERIGMARADLGAYTYKPPVVAGNVTNFNPTLGDEMRRHLQGDDPW